MCPSCFSTINQNFLPLHDVITALPQLTMNALCLLIALSLRLYPLPDYDLQTSLFIPCCRHLMYIAKRMASNGWFIIKRKWSLIGYSRIVFWQRKYNYKWCYAPNWFIHNRQSEHQKLELSVFYWNNYCFLFKRSECAKISNSNIIFHLFTIQYQCQISNLQVFVFRYSALLNFWILK